jgi:hypothetical protein
MSLASPSIVKLPKGAKKPDGVKHTDWDLLLNVGLPKKMIIDPDESHRQHYISFEHLSRGLVEIPPILVR